MGERLGYVVVCFNQASGQDLASGDVLYDDAADAMGCRDGGSGPRSLAGVTAMSSPRSSNWVRTGTVADLEREIETLAALREATRSAREAAKDLRGEVKAAREFRQEFLSTPELDARLGELTAAALASYDEGIKKAIGDATQAIHGRPSSPRPTPADLRRATARMRCRCRTSPAR